MYNETTVRNRLKELGWGVLADCGSFELVKYELNESPIINTDLKNVFDRGKEIDTTKRRHVIYFNDSVLKTGETKDTNEEREQALFEFNASIKKSRRGLPVVKPVTLIYGKDIDCTFLVEPKGRDMKHGMKELLAKYPESENELGSTLCALRKFFDVLKDKGFEYSPNIHHFYLFPFEHMIRFGSESDYEMLITDKPIFLQRNEDNYTNKYMNFILGWFRENFEKGNAGLYDFICTNLTTDKKGDRK